MTLPDSSDHLDAESDDDLASLDAEAEVTCPHCGETMTITLDPAGGRSQEYVEDCEVCCRPWQVRLWYDATGAAEVRIRPVE